MPRPVRALWQGASAPERETAHKTAVAILRTWLGKTTREEAARELGLSAVRLWQLSQQAVCGLVVGCLRQPRYRGRPPAAGSLGEPSLGELRGKISHLERELDASRRLIEVLKDLPGNREAAAAPQTARAGDEGRRGRRKLERADERGAAEVAGKGTRDAAS
jgi:hypothetical protein